LQTFALPALYTWSAACCKHGGGDEQLGTESLGLQQGRQHARRRLLDEIDGMSMDQHFGSEGGTDEDYQKKERGAAILTPREIETLKRPLGLPKGPDLAERNANHIAKSASSRALSRQFANVMQESPTRHGSSQRHAMSKSQEHSHIADIDDAQSVVHKNGSGASGAPPGLDAPTCCKRGPMWKVETGQQPKIWMHLDSVLSWHLEECFRLGLTETWFVENNIHYYFNLNTMCQRDLQTGAEQRIRRFLEWNEVTDT